MSHHVTATEVRSFFRRLSKKLDGKSGVRPVWAGYVFHITHITNAVGILKSNSIYSRSTCPDIGIGNWENASETVLANSDPELSKYARLYFRPKTPTFWANEGFIPVDALRQSELRAHCPIPVAFAFEAAEVLSRPDVRFSAKSLAKADHRSIYERTGDSLDWLESIDFLKVYHDALFSPEERNEIVAIRQAEVIIPEKMPIEGSLRAIRCRTEAELRTFLTLLEESGARVDRSLVRTSQDGSVFHAHRLHINSVSIVNGKIWIGFVVPESRDDWDFRLSVEIELIDDGVRLTPLVLESLRSVLGTSSTISLELRERGQNYHPTSARITIKLNDIVAFYGVVGVGDSLLINRN